MSYLTYEKAVSRLCDLSKDEQFEFRRMVEQARVRLDAEMRKSETPGWGQPKRSTEEYRELSIIVPILEKMLSKL